MITTEELTKIEDEISEAGEARLVPIGDRGDWIVYAGICQEHARRLLDENNELVNLLERRD